MTVKIVRHEKPDIIHCHSAKAGIIGRTAGWITGVRTCYTPHAFSYLCTPSPLKRKIFMCIEKISRLGCYVVACSKSEQRMAVEDVGYPEGHALLWHNSVPDVSIEKGKPVDVSTPYICYIGRPSYQKNPLFLLDVIKRVKEQGYNLKFILLGVGFYSPELQRMKEKIVEQGLKENIVLLPWINHKDCQEYVRKSLFYLTTSLYEGLPLAVIEAMANSKAIVASDVIGNNDCVEDGENGFLLLLDVNRFACKLIRLYDNESLRKKMENASRKLFLDRFFIDRQIDKLQSIYESLL